MHGSNAPRNKAAVTLSYHVYDELRRNGATNIPQLYKKLQAPYDTVKDAVKLLEKLGLVKRPNGAKHGDNTPRVALSIDSAREQADLKQVRKQYQTERKRPRTSRLSEQALEHGRVYRLMLSRGLAMSLSGIRTYAGNAGLKLTCARTSGVIDTLSILGLVRQSGTLSRSQRGVSIAEPMWMAEARPPKLESANLPELDQEILEACLQAADEWRRARGYARPRVPKKNLDPTGSDS